MKGNASKYSGKNVHVNIGTSQIKNSSCERLLGIDTDYKRSFESHINQIFAKAKTKIKTLAMITSFLNKEKRKLANLSLVIAVYHGCFIAVH